MMSLRSTSKSFLSGSTKSPHRSLRCTSPRHQPPSSSAPRRFHSNLSERSNNPVKTLRVIQQRTKATWVADSSSRGVPHFFKQFLYKPRTVPVPRWITPRHSQITVTECFGHVSFCLVAISYAVDDFLLLRMIAVVGSTSMLVFTYFHPHGRVLWLPFKWNVLFIAINCYRIGKVFWTSYLAEQLPQELRDHREKTFYSMDPVDYYRLMSIAEIKEYHKGDLLLSQGEVVPCVRMVLSGQLRVLRDGKLTYMLQEDNFISEAGVHVGLLIPGGIESCCSVVADDDVTRVLSWDRTELAHLMQVHSGLRRSLKAIMSWDIVRKLKAQRSLLTEHLIDDPDQWTARRHLQTNHRYAAILHAILQRPDFSLSQHQFQRNLAKYRMVHHIDDNEHERALADCGWTVAEFEEGKLRNVSIEDDDDERIFRLLANESRDWQWFMRDVYLRLFG